MPLGFVRDEVATGLSIMLRAKRWQKYRGEGVSGVEEAGGDGRQRRLEVWRSGGRGTVAGASDASPHQQVPRDHVRRTVLQEPRRTAHAVSVRSLPSGTH